MVMLKHKFKLRFFIDESVSFGTLGDHGKGITEYAGLELNDIDLIMATLEYSAGSIGGFCVGTTYVVEHQGTRFFSRLRLISRQSGALMLQESLVIIVANHT